MNAADPVLTAPAPRPPRGRARKRPDVLVCDACVQGVARPPRGARDQFGHPCPICRGTQRLSMRRLAKLLREPPSTVLRLVKGPVGPDRVAGAGESSPMRPKVAARLCAKLVLLLEGPKQLRLLSASDDSAKA